MFKSYPRLDLFLWTTDILLIIICYIMDAHMKHVFAILGIFGLVGCASITNDAKVPMSLSFSDGSSGSCQLTNKRMSILAEIPSSHS